MFWEIKKSDLPKRFKAAGHQRCIKRETCGIWYLLHADRQFIFLQSLLGHNNIVYNEKFDYYKLTKPKQH